ncbi:MAG: site-specific integrase [Xanthomonadales bacterium]|nr:site-specific integrase [Xanthomonadales bacterium]
MATYSKLPSGRWRVQVRRGSVYRAHTFDLKRQAKAWATEIEAQALQVQAGRYITPKGLTIGKLVKLYGESVKEGGRTRNACLARLQTALDRIKPHTLPFALRDFIDNRQAAGAGGVTIAQDLSYLASALDWGRHSKRFDVNPEVARDARRSLKHRKLNTRSQSRERLPKPGELDALYKLWDNNLRQQIPMIILVQFALVSAMRLGEICRIQIEDVDFDKKTVLIRQRKDPKRKASNDQIVPLVGDAIAIIQKQIGQRKQGRIFPYDAKSASTAFTRGCKTLGIKDLKFHDLRHAATVQLFRMGLDIPRVAMITGHKSWENLRRYTNLTAEDVHNAFS